MSERLVGDGAVGALGAAFAWALAGPALGSGGLAPLAVTTLAAIVLGLPLVALERGATPPGGPRAAMALAFGDGVARVWAVTLAAAALGALAPALGGATGLVLAVIGLTVAASRGRVPLAAALLGAAAAATLTVGVWDAAASGGPWTLVEPHWGAWRAWGPGALAGGVVVAGAGLGRWRAGADRSPAAVAGLGLALALAVSLGAAAGYEVGAPPHTIPAAARRLALIGGALAITVAAVQPAPDAPRRPAWLPGVALAVLALAFLGPLAPARDAFFSSVLLLGPATVAASHAYAHRDAGALALAGGLTAAAAFGWPGLPTDAAAAAVLALIPVLALWAGGLAALRHAPEPA